MCLNCGCMRAHDDMGKPDVNITYEDLKRAADASGATVDDILQRFPRPPTRTAASTRPSTPVPASDPPDPDTVEDRHELVDDGPIENRPTDVTTDGQTYGG